MEQRPRAEERVQDRGHPGGATRRVSFKPDPPSPTMRRSSRPRRSDRRVAPASHAPKGGPRARKGPTRRRRADLLARPPRSARARQHSREHGRRRHSWRALSLTAARDAVRVHGHRQRGGGGGSVNAGDAFDEARPGALLLVRQARDRRSRRGDTPGSMTGSPSIRPGHPACSYAPRPRTRRARSRTPPVPAAGPGGGARRRVRGGAMAAKRSRRRRRFGFGGGDDGDDADAFFGATPAAAAAKMLVDGGNDPMTDRGEGKRPPLRRLAGVKRPAGTPHKRERKRFERRKSLSTAGLRDDLMETEDGRPLRRSTRERTKPLEYWRGETKKYSRVHQSLPTVEVVRTRTPNPVWPLLPTPTTRTARGARLSSPTTSGTGRRRTRGGRRRRGRRRRRAGARARRRGSGRWRWRMWRTSPTLSSTTTTRAAGSSRMGRTEEVPARVSRLSRKRRRHRRWRSNPRRRPSPRPRTRPSTRRRRRRRM